MELGHDFSNPALLQLALTHPSVARKDTTQGGNNQRLEFLGDAVLSLCISTLLYEKFPDVDEGFLTTQRARLVSTASLAQRARAIHLGERVELNQAEIRNGGRQKESVLADAFEAVLAAIYLDAGLSAAMRWVQTQFAETLEPSACAVPINPKGQLQEQLQAINQIPPTYHLIQSSGPDHARSFQVEVRWNDVVLAQGQGSSKQKAETDAAQKALEKLPLSGPVSPPEAAENNL